MDRLTLDAGFFEAGLFDALDEGLLDVLEVGFSALAYLESECQERGRWNAII